MLSTRKLFYISVHVKNKHADEIFPEPARARHPSLISMISHDESRLGLVKLMHSGPMADAKQRENLKEHRTQKQEHHLAATFPSSKRQQGRRACPPRDEEAKSSLLLNRKPWNSQTKPDALKGSGTTIGLPCTTTTKRKLESNFSGGHSKAAGMPLHSSRPNKQQEVHQLTSDGAAYQKRYPSIHGGMPEAGTFNTQLSSASSSFSLSATFPTSQPGNLNSKSNQTTVALQNVTLFIHNPDTLYPMLGTEPQHGPLRFLAEVELPEDIFKPEFDEQLQAIPASTATLSSGRSVPSQPSTIPSFHHTSAALTLPPPSVGSVGVDVPAASLRHNIDAGVLPMTYRESLRLGVAGTPVGVAGTPVGVAGTPVGVAGTTPTANRSSTLKPLTLREVLPSSFFDSDSEQLPGGCLKPTSTSNKANSKPATAEVATQASPRSVEQFFVRQESPQVGEQEYEVV